MAIQAHRFRLRAPSSEHVSREANITAVRRAAPNDSGAVYEEYDVDEADLEALKGILGIPGCGGGTWEYVGQV
jgi:hypothetical protein